MERYKVVAKDDLEIENGAHTWTKGLDYEVLQRVGYIILATNQGQVNYSDEVKEKVLDQFEKWS